MKKPKKLRNALEWVTDTEAVIGNLSLRLKEIEAGTGKKPSQDWATVVEKFKEFEGMFRSHEQKIEWLNKHQNQCDMDVKTLWDRVTARDRKLEALQKTVIRLQDQCREKTPGKPLVEVFEKEKKANG